MEECEENSAYASSTRNKVSGAAPASSSAKPGGAGVPVGLFGSGRMTRRAPFLTSALSSSSGNERSSLLYGTSLTSAAERVAQKRYIEKAGSSSTTFSPGRTKHSQTRRIPSSAPEVR